MEKFLDRLDKTFMVTGNCIIGLFFLCLPLVGGCVLCLAITELIPKKYYDYMSGRRNSLDGFITLCFVVIHTGLLILLVERMKAVF